MLHDREFYHTQYSARKTRKSPAAFQLICFVPLLQQAGQVTTVLLSAMFPFLSKHFHDHAANAVRSDTVVQ